MTIPNDTLTLPPTQAVAFAPHPTAPAAANIPAGHRLASHDEAGWAWAYIDDSGERRSIWITDAPDAPLPTRTPIPATCAHSDRPAWPVSETQLCHECEDRRFRAEMFALGARAAGFPVTEQAAVAMVVTLDTLGAAVLAPAAVEVAA